MKKRKKFKHLDKFDRDRIEALINSGHKQNEVAKILKVDESTISREKNRKKKNRKYDSDTANHKALVKRSNSKYCGMKIEQNKELKERIINELKNKRSPDEIAGRMKIENLNPKVSTNSIYKWLYSPFGQQYCKYLCTRRYRKRKQTKKNKRVMIPNKKPLVERPEKGVHGEFDTFVNKNKYQGNTSVAVVSDIQSKLFKGEKIKNLKPKIMTSAVNNLLDQINIDTLTGDNGIENRDHENYSSPAYFCDPHSPWQKPHVENNIGLLRKWFVPKKRNLSKLSQKELDRYIDIINRKYRKSLGYKSAYEVAFENGIISEIPRLVD